jgi:hypothetical protein
LTTVPVEYAEDDGTENMTDAEQRASGLAREEDFDDNLVVELMENLTTSGEV